MQRLTDNELDALEVAHKAATPGEITLIPNGGIDDDPCEQYWALTAGVGHNEGPFPGFRLTGFISAHDASLIALAHNALPALLVEVRELRRLTTPEPIGEEHRDGSWWLVWEPGFEGWFKVRWRSEYGDWQKSGTTEHLLGTPTHALPLPEAPE
jgi:hypothetical protein